MTRAPGWDDDPWERLRYCVQQVESYRGFENYVMPPDDDEQEAIEDPSAAFALAASERYERALNRLWDEMEREAASKAAAARTPSRSRWKRRLLLGLALRRWRR